MSAIHSTHFDFRAIGKFKRGYSNFLEQGGQVFVLPRRLIEFDSEAAVCRIPAFDETGGQVYDRLAASPLMEAGMQAFSNSKATLGCRIIETESSRVLGVANLQLSFREIMDAPANIPVVHGRVASEAWATTANTTPERQ